MLHGSVVSRILASSAVEMLDIVSPDVEEGTVVESSPSDDGTADSVVPVEMNFKSCRGLKKRVKRHPLHLFPLPRQSTRKHTAECVLLSWKRSSRVRPRMKKMSPP